MGEVVAVVQGRRIELVDAAIIRARVVEFADVVMDLGTGDGRWLYRYARTHPHQFCLGIDANADVLREVSWRTQRRPARGGIPNLVFVRAGLEALPGGLASLAAEVHVQYPWGSLLQAVLCPGGGELKRIAGLLRNGGLLRILVNSSALQSAILRDLNSNPNLKVLLATRRDPRLQDDSRLIAGLRSAYASAGLRLRRYEVSDATPGSTWAARLGQGRPLNVLHLEAEKV